VLDINTNEESDTDFCSFCMRIPAVHYRFSYNKAVAQGWLSEGAVIFRNYSLTHPNFPGVKVPKSE